MARDEITAMGEPRSAAAGREGAPRVLIGIATFRRREGLMRALDGVARLRCGLAAAVEVAVVDNCPDACAAEAVRARAAAFALPLVYLHEPARGISHARNRALAEARARGATYLAFLDDDEEPTEGWLEALLRIAEASGAAAVVGPVAGRFASEPAAWMRRGRFFDIPGGRDAAPIVQNTAGNSLIRVETTARLGLGFDPAFGLTGGEDAMFFGALRAAGEATWFAADALVIEDIPTKRASLGWLVRRWFRTGVTGAAVRLALEPASLGARTRLALGGLARLGLGSTLALVTAPAALVGRAEPFRFVQLACRGAGFCAGACDVRYEEYGVDRKV